MQIRFMTGLIATAALSMSCQGAPQKVTAPPPQAESSPTSAPDPTPGRAEEPMRDALGETEGEGEGETEGDENLVGLIGTYKIEGALRGKVYAFSEAEIAGFMGKELVITPSSLSTPWLECDAAVWTHEGQLSRDEWLPQSPQVEGEAKLLEGLAANNEGVVPWKSPCGTVEAGLMQLVPSGTVAMSWDGVTFIARFVK